MLGRVGALHLHYRTPRRGSLVTAQLPSLDRAVHARLAEALDQRLSEIFDADLAVVVIRDLTAAVTLRPSDLSLDARVVDKIAHASAGAVTRVVTGEPSPDAIVRFADQAEFIGSFIVDVLHGAAWDRWYYGAFRAYRGADAKASIHAVLAAHGAEAGRVLAWLARRGHLEAVIDLVGPASVHRLVTTGSDGAGEPLVPNDVAPLADAALQILDALGWCVEAGARLALVSRYLAREPIPPSWTDRRSLSAWVLEFVRVTAASLVAPDATTVEQATNAVNALLHDVLDWLDVEWLAPRVVELRAATGQPRGVRERPATRVLTPRQERALEHARGLVLAGRLVFDRGESRDRMIVRLVAAMAEAEQEAAVPDRTLLTAVERIVDAWRELIAGAHDARSWSAAIDPRPYAQSAPPTTRDRVLARTIESVRTAGPAATELLRTLLRTTAEADDAGEATSGAGLYLLTRALLDVKLPAIAVATGVPLSPVLGAMAMRWLGLSAPFDGPTTEWVGARHVDFAALDRPDARLGDLHDALLDLLVDRRLLDEETAADDIARDVAPFAPPPECPTAIAPVIERIAALLMRAWASWLPGVARSSTSFLVQNCLQRSGRVRVWPTAIDVQLDSAPLDAVVQMAGYFSPIEVVPWLGGRRITFAVRRAPHA